MALFRNEQDLLDYQNSCLCRLDSEICGGSISITTSGSTNNIPKKHQFPKKMYSLVDNHHMWRIFESNRIETGRALRIFQAHSVAKNSLVGPFFAPNMGIENQSWEVIYNPSKVNKEFWAGLLNKVRDMELAFLYTTPSVFTSMKEHLDGPFGFPVIFSCETLTDHVRTESSRFFTRTIDKMRDWSTGFGFFECRLGTKHVYDDLCTFRNDGAGRLLVQDLFNCCDNSQKISDDVAFTTKKLCECGVYGNTIDSFEGKIFECLVSMAGIKYSSNYVSNSLLSLHSKGVIIDGYQIVQDKSKNICVRTENELTNDQALELADVLDSILMDKHKAPKSTSSNVYKDGEELRLDSAQSQWIRIEKSDPVLNRNKKISLRSFAIS